MSLYVQSNQYNVMILQTIRRDFLCVNIEILNTRTLMINIKHTNNKNTNKGSIHGKQGLDIVLKK